MVPKVVKALSKSALFAGLKPQSLSQVAVRGELLRFDAGEVVVEEGSASDAFFFVMGGAVRVMVGKGDEALEASLLASPECFGEMGLLLEQPRTATIVAKNTATLLKFSRQLFDHFMAKLPEFGLCLAKFMAQRLSRTSQLLPMTAHDGAAPSSDVRDLLPKDVRERHRVMPLANEGNVVTLGFVADPQPKLVSRLRHHLRGMELKLTHIEEERFDEIERGAAVPEAFRDSGKRETQAPAKSSPNLDIMLKRMVAEGASDLHLSGNQVPRWRIDGQILAIEGSRAVRDREVLELLEPIMRPVDRHCYEEEHDVDFAYAIPGVSRFRVNLFRDRGGVSAVFRQIPEKIVSLEQLALPSVVESICNYPKGLVLVTGPTGSGKSTTLAAMVDHINRSKRSHIITLEDPIEFVHDSRKCLINQREIGPHSRTFSRALKAALREDPDIVLVGEMRDLETVSLALETANTGHLVFGTLHTSTAIGTVDRIIDLFPPEQQEQVRSQLADSLRAVLAQTLCRKTGGGRVAALEILISNAAVANTIREGRNSQIMSIMTTQKGIGNRVLSEELAKLVKEKVVDYEEALAKATDKAELARLCGQPVPKV